MYLNFAPLDPLWIQTASTTLSFLFLWTAFSKFRDLVRFEGIIANYHLLPASVTGLAARAVPVLECAAAGLLSVNATRSIGAALAMMLLLCFTLGMAINLARGRDRIDCGCGGDNHVPLGAGLLVRNLVLLMLPLLAAWPLALRDQTWIDGLAVLFASTFLFGIYLTVLQLLANNYRTTESRNI